MSVTLMRTWTVPDLAGFPLSTAVSTKSKELCFSRSNAVSSTNSGCLLTSELSFKAREKDGLLVRW
uniref:Uncharacterized protein n=1 Tax=Zonotrichia albicollis TaxID=44394 RepID=A0A8D2QC29_ZONAL